MIHRTAIIDPKAKISKNVKIGAYSVIGPNVEIGEGSDIQSHVTIIGYTNNVLVGENSNSIYHTDKITTQSGPGWAVVRWDNNNESVYPIGAENLYSLGIED